MAHPPAVTGGPPVVEVKVAAAAATSLAIGVAVALLNGIQGNSTLLGGLPTWAQTIILLAVPPLLTFLAGYAAPHTARPDLVPAPPPTAEEPPPGTVLGWPAE